MKDRIKKAVIIMAVIVVVNLGLTFGKLYVGLVTNSICVLLDATNSFFDILTGLITIGAFLLLLKPHKLGYGRAEYLATFVVSIVSLIFGAVFLYRSLSRFTMPEPVRSDGVSIIIVSIAVPIKIALAVFVKIANRKLDSSALKAISIDSLLDAGVTLASLLSVTLSSKLEYTIDAVFGMGVSIFVIIAAIKLLVQYVKRLLVGDDLEPIKEKIKAIVSNGGQTVEIGDITIHDYGYGKLIADVEVIFDQALSLTETIEQSQNITRTISSELNIKSNIIPIKGGTQNG